LFDNRNQCIGNYLIHYPSSTHCTLENSVELVAIHKKWTLHFDIQGFFKVG